jgi:hypothetical protein
MIGTVILWVVGIVLVFVASTEDRFLRIFGSSLRARYGLQQRVPGWRRPSARGHEQTARWTMLGCGGLFIVIAAGSTWSLVR